MDGDGGRGETDVGTLLRRFRLRSGLSQDELAARSTVSVRTVREIEAGRVTRPRPGSLRLLAQALDLPARDRSAFLLAAARDPTPGAVDSVASVPYPLTPTVGRDADVAGVLRLLDDGARLVTVTGLAGVGKTRVAMEVAARLPACWVPLSEVASADLGWDAVAVALSGRVGAVRLVADLLGSCERVLVVDAVAHLGGLADVLVELLGACAGLRVLATSRRPLDVRGEYEWPLAPLDVPGGDDARTTDTLAGVPSVRMLVDRIRAHRPSFELGTHNAADVVALCRLLDGIPLALELAAGQCRVLEPADVVARLRRSPARDVDRALDASVELLSAPVRQALVDLSTCRGGWTLDAAGAVTAAGEESIPHLDTLMGHGLIQRDASGRFAMLETIRTYAARGPANPDGAARRHAIYFSGVATDLQADLPRAGSARAMTVLEAETENMRAALAWCQRDDRVLGLRLTTLLHAYWQRRGRYREGGRWFQVFLPEEVDTDRAADLARSASRATELAILDGDLPQARRHLDLALLAGQQAGDDSVVADTSFTAATLAWFEGDNTGYVARNHAAATAARRAGNEPMVAAVLANLALGLTAAGRYAEADTAAQEAMALADRLDLRYLAAASCNALANNSRAQGQPADADAYLVQMERILADIGGTRYQSVDCAAVRCVVQARLGNTHQARGLLSHAEEVAGDAPSEMDRANLAYARAELALATGNDPITTVQRCVEAVRILTKVGEHWAALDALAGLAVSLVDHDPDLAAAAAGLADHIAAQRNIRPARDAAIRLARITGRGHSEGTATSVDTLVDRIATVVRRDR